MDVSRFFVVIVVDLLKGQFLHEQVDIGVLFEAVQIVSIAVQSHQ